MSIDLNQISQLLTAIAQTDITELNLKCEEFELNIKRDSIAVASVIPLKETVSAVPVTTKTTPVVSEQSNRPTGNEKKWEEVKSPMVGTFYRSPGPDQPPYVGIGDRIRKGQVLCIIEAMKTMNEIEAEISGQVMEILVDNAIPVEYDQPLMRINPE